MPVNNPFALTFSGNIAQWNSVNLGSPSNYGTSPGAVSVIGVNAFITNIPAVTQSGNWTTRIVGNAGATLDGTVVSGTAPTNGLAILGQYNTTIAAPTAAQTVSLQLDQNGNLLEFPGVQFEAGAAWTTATALNTLQYPTGTATEGQISAAPAYLVQLVINSGTFTAGAVTFQGTYDNTNWITIPVAQVLNPATYAQLTNPYTFVASSNVPFLILSQGFLNVRAKLSTAITGSSSPTVTPNWATLAYTPAVQVAGTVTANAGTGTFNIQSNASVNVAQVNGNTTVTAATGVQKVGVVGNAGAIFDGATATSVPANAVQAGARAATAYPTAVTDGQLVAPMADKAGRPAVVLNTVRDLIGTASVQSTSGSLATFIASGGANVFTDILELVFTNESATATIVSLSDGTTTYKFALAGNGGMAKTFATPLVATSSATAWQVSNSAAVNVDCVAVYAKNK